MKTANDFIWWTLYSRRKSFETLLKFDGVIWKSIVFYRKEKFYLWIYVLRVI